MPYCDDCYRYGQQLVACCGKQRCPACHRKHRTKEHPSETEQEDQVQIRRAEAAC
jgi:hypothetical protein